MKYSPLILESINDSGKPLHRIESQANDVKSERWLQELIFHRPEILPVQYFDESYAPLIPIGREVGTNAGPIDNLYISPRGCLTIVETKLWKNPEKHRTVVAQVVDYAKEISKWNYEDLNEAVLQASRKSSSNNIGDLEQIIKPVIEQEGIALNDFQERVIQNLENGEFLLLIVGDKISPNVAFLSESIQGAPGLNFRLQLIELQLYPVEKGKDWPLLVVPDIVGTTKEITRGVIKIQYEDTKPKNVVVDIPEKDGEQRSSQILTLEDFLVEVPVDMHPVYEKWFEELESKNLFINWSKLGFSLKANVNGKQKAVFENYHRWGLTLIRESDLNKFKATDEQYANYRAEVSKVPEAFKTLSNNKVYIKHERINNEQLEIILSATTKFAEEVNSDGGK